MYDFIIISDTQLRHASDAYIRVEAITDGCASQSTTAANCFNKGKWDHRWTIISLFVYGVVSVIALIVVGLLVEKINNSLLFCFLRERFLLMRALQFRL